MKKITAIVVALALLCTGLVPAMPAQADPVATVPLAAEAVPSPTVPNAVKSLERQTKDKYEDNTSLKMLFSLSDEYMEKAHGLQPVPVAERKGAGHLDEQLDYAEKARAVFVTACEKVGVTPQITETYDVAFTGVAMQITVADARKIAALPEVRDVEVCVTYTAPTLKKMRRIGKRDTSSNVMVEADKAWLGKYEGRGQLIAVIDSGADPTHPAFQHIDVDSSTRFMYKEEVQKVIQGGKLKPGHFYSQKIPFGYNYASNNTIIKENSPQSHGMHVAGIIAANDPSPHGLKGVAPQAQLAVMRVFASSSFGGTTAEIYGKAMDDAVKLGCDSINMSLGATAGNESSVAPVTLNALKDAEAAGILVSIAAGNDGFFGNGVVDKPSADNPDIGMLSSPGVSPLSLCVASLENMSAAEQGMRVDSDPNKIIQYADSGAAPLPAEFVGFKDCGKGTAEECADANPQGVFALIERGDAEGHKDFSFVDKINNAKAAGAIGAIVYDNLPDEPLTMMVVKGTTIPSAFIAKKDGEYLKENPQSKVRFDKEYVFADNAKGGQPSDFSSWGLTPEGNLKPDISAPGGRIYSTLNDGSYGVMSGTSMAAPHVAGGIAIARQRVKNDFPAIKGAEQYRLVKNILMSTAQPVNHSETGAYISPRQQGAGLMKLDAAIRTPAVFEGTNGIASVTLGGKLAEDRVQVPATLYNASDKTVTYRVYGVLNSDVVENGNIMLKPRLLAQSGYQTVTVAPGQRQTIEVAMAVPEGIDLQKDMPNGYFLEGFLFAEADDLPTISMPFVGFRGNFEKLNVIDPSIYDLVAADKRPYYYGVGGAGARFYTHLSTDVDGKKVALGENADSTAADPSFDKAHIAFSPNGDGNAEQADFYATFLRNFKSFSMEVSDENGNVVRRVFIPEDNGPKNFYHPMMPNGNLVTHKSHWTWDGFDASAASVPDGRYTMTIQSAAEGGGNEKQTMQLPIIVDRIYPRLVRAHFDGDRYIIDALEENGSGLRDVMIVEGDKTVRADEQNSFDVSEFNRDKAVVVIRDHAWNTVKIPLAKAAREGSERRVIVNGITGNGSIPSEAFRWTVQTMDGTVEDPYNLPVGKHKLVIHDVDPAYTLLDESPIAFEITEQDQEKVININFQSNQTYDMKVNVDNPHRYEFSFYAVNINTKKRFEPVKGLGKTYTFKVPEGRYRIVVNGLPDEAYAVLPDGDEKEIGRDMPLRTFGLKIIKKRAQDIAIHVDRGDYKGPFSIVFTGNDVAKTEQVVAVAENESDLTASIVNIKSQISVRDLSDGHYGIDPFMWEMTGTKPHLNITLKRFAEVQPGYVDKSALRALVKEALALKKEDYDTSSEEGRQAWEYVELMILSAQVNMEKPGITQEDIDGIYNNLKEGMARLIKLDDVGKVDKSALKKAIERAESLKKASYTADSWANLQKALKDAKAVFADENAQQEDVTNQANLLDIAIADLTLADEETIVDKKALNDAIEAAKALQEAAYQSKTWKPFAAALERAINVSAGNYADQALVDSTLKALQEAQKNLRKVVQKGALRKAVEAANHLIASDYDATGWQVFEKALKAAEAVLADEQAEQKDVDQALADLEAARGGLQQNQAAASREALTAAVAAAEKLVESDYSAASWAPFVKALDAAKQVLLDEKSTQTDYDSAAKALQAAITALAPLDEAAQTAYALALLDVLTSYAEGLDRDTLSGDVAALETAIANGRALLKENDDPANEAVRNANDDLRDALAAIQSTAQPVQIDLPAQWDAVANALVPTDITLRDKAHLLRLKAVLDNFTEEERSGLAYEANFRAALAALEALNDEPAAQALRDAIAALPDVSALTLADEEAVLAVRARVDAAPQRVRNLLSKEDVQPLLDCEAALVTLKEEAETAIEKIAQEIRDAIAALPTEKDIRKGDQTAIEAVRKLVNGADAAVRARLSREDLAPLEAAEAALARLQKQKEDDKPTPKPTPWRDVSDTTTPSVRTNKSSSHTKTPAKATATPAKNVTLSAKDKPTKKPVTKRNSKTVVQKQSLALAGFKDGTFRPDNHLSRAELAALLARVSGDAGKDGTVVHFSDVTSVAWYADAVQKLARQGIIGGYADGSFRGDRAVTRAEFVAMLAKWQGLHGGDHRFADVSQHHWAHDAIAAAADRGWIVGISADTFAPDRALTRAEAVVILNRVLGINRHTVPAGQHFVDVPIDHWAYLDIAIAGQKN